MLYDCVTVGGGRCVVILTFVFFGAKWLDVCGLPFRANKTIYLARNVHVDVVCTA